MTSLPLALSAVLVLALSGCQADIRSGPGGQVNQPIQLGVVPASADFTAPAGGPNPAPQNVSIINAGVGVVTGLGVGTVLYEPVVGGWLTTSIGGATFAPATLTLSVDVAGMAPGLYFAIVPVVSTITGVLERDVVVSLTITPVPVIDASPDTVQLTGTVGGANPAPQPVDITNIGTGSLTGMTVGTISYDTNGTGWLNGSLNQPTDPAILTLQANTTGLAVGTYEATVPVVSSTSGVLEDTVTVLLTLSASPTPPAIAIAPTSITLAADAGGAAPASRTVAVTNSGGGTLSNLILGTIAYTPAGGSWLTSSLNQTTAPATLTIGANTTGLAAGNYRAILPVAAVGASNTPRNVTVNLRLAAANALQVSPATVAFAGTIGQPSPSSAKISVTNAGTSPLGGIATSLVYGAGQPTGWLQLTQSGISTPAALVLTPNVSALPAGTFNATITVSSTTPGITSKTITVQFDVAAQSGFFNILKGDGQTGLVDSILDTTLVARITDGNFNPVPNVSVVWTVQNGGTLLNTSSVTNAQGEVSTRWKLGHFASIHTVSVASAGLPVLTFAADAQLPSSGGAQHPNEPLGFVRFAEHNMSSLPNFPRSIGGLAGSWFGFPQNDPDLAIVNPDTSAPESPPLTVRTRYRAGLNGGNAPVNIGGWDAAGTGGAGQKSKIYVSMWLKVLGTDYENHPVGTKMGFIAYGESPSAAQNQGVFRLKGTGSVAINSSYKVEVHQQNHVNRVLVQQTPGNPMTIGVWHQWEMVMELNTLGQADGILKWWIDGTLVIDYDDVEYITAGNTTRFHGWKWNPTWGGVGSVKTRDDFMAIDHIYISGIP